MAISILVADDQEVVREGLRAMLLESEIQVVAEAATGSRAIELTEKHQPDVVLLDVRMPDGDGVTALGRIKQARPHQAVLMLSAFDNPSYTAKAIAMGANGFLLKGASRDEIVQAIELAARGEFLWTRTDLRRVTGALATPRLAGQLEVPLTQREAEVLVAVANGNSNEQIAEQLSISYETVKEHVQHVLRKVGVESRTQAAIWAVRRGLA